MTTEHGHEHHHHHPDHVHLRIVTLSGSYSHEFNVHERLRTVVHDTLKHLHIVPAPNEDWQLKDNDRVLDFDKTIEQEHIPNDATLMLAPKESGGG